MLSPVTGLMRLASVGICLIVISSFVIFAVNQTARASTHQQRELNGETTTAPATTGSAQSTEPHIGGVHRVIDEASNTLTSPFSAVTAGSSSEWTVRGVNLLLTLMVYGFGIGFLVRVIRVGL